MHTPRRGGLEGSRGRAAAFGDSSAAGPAVPGAGLVPPVPPGVPRRWAPVPRGVPPPHPSYIRTLNPKPKPNNNNKQQKS